MGVLSAPLHPALARSVAHWVPPRRSSRTNGLVNGAALVGIAVTPLFFGALIDRFDWPAAFLIMAVVTTALGVVWTVYAADKTSGPDELTSEGLPQEHTESLSSWLALFRHRGLLLLTLSYGCVGYFQYLFFYWMNYYFQTVLHLPPSREPHLRRDPPAGDGRGDAAGGLALRSSGTRPRHGEPAQGRPDGGHVGRGRLPAVRGLRSRAGVDRGLVRPGAGGGGDGGRPVLGHGHRPGRPPGGLRRGGPEFRRQRRRIPRPDARPPGSARCSTGAPPSPSAGSSASSAWCSGSGSTRGTKCAKHRSETVHRDSQHIDLLP